MVDMRLDSSSDSGSSDCESDSGFVAKLDNVGRPLTRPVYVPIGASSVLSRVKEFLPLFRDATLQLSEPKIMKESIPEIQLPTQHDSSDPDDSMSSESSYGVQVELGLGVFDVNGPIDEEALARQGTPVLFTEDEPTHAVPSQNASNPLIEEISSTAH